VWGVCGRIEGGGGESDQHGPVLLFYPGVLCSLLWCGHDCGGNGNTWSYQR